MGGLCSQEDLTIVEISKRNDPEDYKLLSRAKFTAKNLPHYNTCIFENTLLPFASLRVDIYEALIKCAATPSSNP